MGSLVIAIVICLIDYVMAYTVLGLGGIFRKKTTPAKALVLGSVLALTLRYACHVVSGAIFYGAWAEWFFGDAIGQLAVSRWVLDTFSGHSLAALYSFVYNGCYMIPEMILTPLVALCVWRIPVLKNRELV
jgi:thiamine transporter